MKKISICVLALIVLVACETRKKENATADNITANSDPGQNKLTQAQSSDGWKLLFDGETMDGWHYFKNKESDSWEVVDGTLHCKAFDNAKKRADIMTVDQYENFELAFDWKLAPQSNSGVMFRVTEEFDEPYLTGPEYQIIDDKGYPGDPLKASQLTGGNYDMHAAPADKPINAVGEWNTSRLVVNGNHVEHWLNGAKVVEYDLQSDEWTNLKNNSKWKDAVGYGMAKKGHIDFQDHGMEAWFRNIMIKTL